MKKYITIAALLAAGTAFSNAASVVLDESTMAGYAVVVIDDIDTFSSHNGGNVSQSNIAHDIFHFTGTWNASGYSGYVGIATNGSSSDKHTEFYGDYERDGSTGTALKLGDELSTSIFTASTDWDSISSISVAYSFDSAASSTRVGIYAAVTILYIDGTYATYTGSNTADLGWSNGDYSFIATGLETSSTYNAAIYEYGSVVKTTNELAALSVSAVIPEPSAFGLLAGVGALALVASRRRRTK